MAAKKNIMDQTVGTFREHKKVCLTGLFGCVLCELLYDICIRFGLPWAGQMGLGRSGMAAMFHILNAALALAQWYLLFRTMTAVFCAEHPKLLSAKQYLNPKRGRVLFLMLLAAAVAVLDPMLRELLRMVSAFLESWGLDFTGLLSVCYLTISVIFGLLHLYLIPRKTAELAAGQKSPSKPTGGSLWMLYGIYFVGILLLLAVRKAAPFLSVFENYVRFCLMFGLYLGWYRLLLPRKNFT